MPRPALDVGTYGKILTKPAGDTFEARCRFRDYDGHTRQIRAFGSSITAAERALKKKIRDRAESGGAVITGDTRLTAVIDLWLTEIAEDIHIAEGTRRVYSLTVRKHLRPALGQLRVRECTVPAVNRCLRAIRDNHGRGAAKTTRTVLSGVLGLAVRAGAIGTNPVREAVKLPAEKKSATRALTVAETEQLCDLLRADVRAVTWDLPDLVEWMLYTGCRIGEALAARADTIDLDAGTWEVNATVIRVTGQGLLIQQRTKTDAGWRVLALPAGAVEMIRRRQGEVRLTPPSGIVFGSPLAKALRDPSNTSADLKATLATLGLPEGDEGPGPFSWATSHTFRKTVATRLDEAGLTPRQIADQLGHAKPSMTLDVYMGRNVVNADAARILDR